MSITFEPARAEAFAETMLRTLNAGALAVMTSVGHRTGLFDTMARLPPSTSAEIATAAGLDERYVREWLGAMTTGKVVTYEPEAGRYALPPEHAACLTRAASPNNLAVFSQYIPLLGAVEDGIVRCFREGGGLPYEAYPRFHEVMAEDSGETVVSALRGHILPLVPGLEAALARGIDVLDVGCGRGRALLALARDFPQSRFEGLDFSAEAIAFARDEAQRAGLGNVRFRVDDATAFRDEGRFDLVTTFDAIHDQARPAEVLRNIRRALRPEGVYLMQDIGGRSRLEDNLEHPLAPLLYTISTFHCMSVSLAAGGEGLGTMWGIERARQMLAEAGFRRVEVERLPHDPQNAYFIARTSNGPKPLGRAATSLS